jgi:hypothetical protein
MARKEVTQQSKHGGGNRDYGKRRGRGNWVGRGKSQSSRGALRPANKGEPVGHCTRLLLPAVPVIAPALQHANGTTGDGGVHEACREHRQSGGDEWEYDRNENRRNDNHPPFFPRSSSKYDGGNNNINSGSGTPLAGRQQEELHHSQDVDAIEIDTSLDEIHEGIRQLHKLALRHREEVCGHGDMLDIVDGRANHLLIRTTKAASKVERFSRRV